MSQRINAIEQGTVIEDIIWPAVTDSVLSHWHQESVYTTTVTIMEKSLNFGCIVKQQL